jgi:3-phosphoshikimate 1-carboxyvinyltransferase
MTDVRIKIAHRPIDATVRLPGSKSLTNRALIIAGLARGSSRLEGVGLADDTRYMIQFLKGLGIEVSLDEPHCAATVRGCGGHIPADEADLFCGNAGTVMRFGTAMCCLGAGRYRVDGAERMRNRPIGPLVDVLRDLGASIGYEGTHGFPPLTVAARGLHGGQASMRASESSQFVSAVLMAAPYARTDVMLRLVGEVVSEPYISMTLRMMEDFGAGVLADRGKYIVPAAQTYAGRTCRIEPDASAASYFLAAAALTGGRVTVEGLGRRSVQGDVGFAGVLEQMGCRIEQDDTSTTVTGPKGGRLRGIDVDLNAMPDMAQTLAVLALFAAGPTNVRNVANLRIKETDRISAVAAELAKFGATVQTRDDGFAVTPPVVPRPAEVDTYDDHRMAMSFALAGLRIDGVVIRGAECVSKTFPDFFEVFEGMSR